MNVINQANQLFQQGSLQKAEVLYRQLLKENPQNINSLFGLGKIALALDSYQSAYDIFKKCTQLCSKEPRVWLSFAQACQKLTRFDETERALNSAYILNKNYRPSLLSTAIYYCESGDFNKAKERLLALLTIKPEDVQAFCLLVRIGDFNLSDKLAQQMLDRLSPLDTQVTLYERVNLHYAFFSLHHQNKLYKQAFEHLQKANDHQYSSLDFSVEDMQPFFNNLLSCFNEKSLSNPQKFTNTTALTPIFIVGQPRSGTTLLEQMLIGHQQINSAGELPFLAGDIANAIRELTGESFPQGCRLLSNEQRKKLGDHYLKSMQTIAPQASYIIDKMPANFQSIGLIKQLMPEAKIIHIKREVVDVSWSIFQNNFEAQEPYFCSLKDIMKYNDCYQRVMKHWYTIIPEFIHTIDYSKLVSEPQQEITNALAFCGLEYQEECINFSVNKRHISTLSDIQLRNGIKKNQTRAYLPYQEYLKPEWDDLI